MGAMSHACLGMLAPKHCGHGNDTKHRPPSMPTQAWDMAPDGDLIETHEK